MKGEKGYSIRLEKIPCPALPCADFPHLKEVTGRGVRTGFACLALSQPAPPLMCVCIYMYI